MQLVGSVPGTHKGGDAELWCHRRLRAVLSRAPAGSDDDILIAQCSSVGSMAGVGKAAKRPARLAGDWLEPNLLGSLCPGPGGRPKLSFIFPTIDDVRNSSEGYAAGESIPCV